MDCTRFYFDVFLQWIIHLPPYVDPRFGKSILNALVCKFGKMENTFLLYVYLGIIYWYMLLLPST